MKKICKESKNAQMINQADKRIMIVGCPASGKTTFARLLGSLIGREIIHLDKILWKPNWEEMPYEQRKKIHDTLIQEDEWLIEGMWRSHVADRIERATKVYFLDYSTMRCKFNALTRWFTYYGKQRSDMQVGCLEKIDKDFWHYISTFNKVVRPYLLELFEKNLNVEIVTFKSPKQAVNYLTKLSKKI
ncbi:MAG: hypothetical protein RR086_00760 [Clostridia bacterium]